MTNTPPPPVADPAKRFEPALEGEYLRTRLRSGRTLIRMACLLALAITGMRIAELTVTGTAGRVPYPGFILPFPAVVLATSLALAWLAWSPSFERLYLRFANFLVPVRNIFASIAIAVMSVQGQVELLMVLPVMVLSPFFFLGLHFRPALTCVVLTIAAFTISALALDLSTPILVRTCGFLVVTAATSAVAAWQLEKQSRRSFLESRLIAELSEHDPLTGAKNRRVFDEHLARLWQQAVDENRRIAILLIDVDHFKAYNDHYGHQAGDITLQRVAKAVQAEIRRPMDVMARYGGEEFAAILYDMEGAQARDIAERMRHAVGAMAIEHRASRVARVVTISIGIAAFRPSAARAPRGGLQLADEALYTAKVRGRNNVHLAADADYDDLQTGVFAQGPVVD